MKTVMLMLICLIAWPAAALAEEESVANLFQRRTVLPAGQVVQGDYFAFGPHVEISGTVNGDVYAAGGEVLVDGTVNGDVIVAGGRVTISGPVAQDVRVIGGQVILGGSIGKNGTVGGVDVQVMESAVIQDSLLVGAEQVLLAGSVGHDVRMGAGVVTVASRIGRDLTVAAGNIRLTSHATVGRMLRYWHDTAPSIDEGATVHGGIVHRPLPAVITTEQLEQGLIGVLVVVGVANFVSSLLLGLLLTGIYPAFMAQAGDTIRRRPWATIGAGFFTCVGVPMVIGLCIMTVVGLPLAAVLGALYLVSLYLARLFAMVWVGQLVLGSLSESPSVRWAFVLGLVLYTLLSLIPVAGHLVTLAACLVGLGGLVITKAAWVARLRREQVL